MSNGDRGYRKKGIFGRKKIGDMREKIAIQNFNKWIKEQRRLASDYVSEDDWIKQIPVVGGIVDWIHQAGKGGYDVKAKMAEGKGYSGKSEWAKDMPTSAWVSKDIRNEFTEGLGTTIDALSEQEWQDAKGGLAPSIFDTIKTIVMLHSFFGSLAAGAEAGASQTFAPKIGLKPIESDLFQQFNP